MMPRRQWLKAALAAVAALWTSRKGAVLAATPAFDFDSNGIEGWTVVAGQWAVEEMAGAPSGTKVLVQRATKNEFNVIVAPATYADVDVTVKFKPIAGRGEASGGIVFRVT